MEINISHRSGIPSTINLQKTDFKSINTMLIINRIEDLASVPGWSGKTK
jgi:hypothetical protein